MKQSNYYNRQVKYDDNIKIKKNIFVRNVFFLIFCFICNFLKQTYLQSALLLNDLMRYQVMTFNKNL